MQPTDAERLASLRLDRAIAKGEGNIAQGPLDALRSAAHDLASGKKKCTAVLVIMMDAPDNPTSPWTIHRIRAGMPRDLEVVALQQASYLTMKDWMES
jgi:hypothetical protein